MRRNRVPWGGDGIGRWWELLRSCWPRSRIPPRAAGELPPPARSSPFPPELAPSSSGLHAAVACAAVRRSASDHGLRAMPAFIAGVMRMLLCILTKL